jgi:MSHA biogenesis protein MshP
MSPATPACRAAEARHATPVANPRRRAVRGYALVPAIFLIVVLSALAAWAVRLNVQQQQTVDLALLGSRALSAANAGVEWGAWRALNGACAAGTLPMTEGALNGFEVAVTCTATTFVEGSATVAAYTIDSIATAGRYGAPGYVRRSVRVTLTAAT